jgi:hypothetical protein
MSAIATWWSRRPYVGRPDKRTWLVLTVMTVALTVLTTALLRQPGGHVVLERPVSHASGVAQPLPSEQSPPAEPASTSPSVPADPALSTVAPPLPPQQPAKVAKPSGPTLRPITGQIVGYAGKCIDVSGGYPTNGTPIVLWDCHGGNNQKWTVAPDRLLRALGKCLDVTDNRTDNGTMVQLWDCNGGGNQQWVPQTNGSLLNPQSGRCLDAPGGSRGSGTRLQLWDCHGGPNQQWKLS